VRAIVRTLLTIARIAQSATYLERVNTTRTEYVASCEVTSMMRTRVALM
jgi:hypothetical protein